MIDRYKILRNLPNKAHVRGVSQERNLESDEIAMGSAINPRIPIVDDDENVLEIATTLIRRLGYTALTASNGGGRSAADDCSGLCSEAPSSEDLIQVLGPERSRPSWAPP
jgi:hypothetical protein